jgi:ATP-dependent RNA helicase DDX5/DBP2
MAPESDARELKKEKKSKRRAKEADGLETSEHKEDLKRIRAYSREFEEGSPKRTKADDGSTMKRRTRSMDAAEEKQVKQGEDLALSLPEWRKEHSITITGHGSERSKKDFADPFRAFSNAPFNDRIQQAFAKAGFDKPTAIQAQAWPIALQGKDMICVAKTGSGKTCGFLLPAFHQHLQKNPQVQGFTKPVLLVLAPTRELSVQIMEEAQKFGRVIGIRSVCIYGGAPKYPQIATLARGVECIIATPGMYMMNDSPLSGFASTVLNGLVLTRRLFVLFCLQGVSMI